MDRRSLSEDAPESQWRVAYAYVRQGRCRGRSSRSITAHRRQADQIVVPKVSGRRPSGSRRAAPGVGNNRSVCSETVEDHDRRFWHRRPLTWRSSRVFSVLNTTQFLARRPGADLARRKSSGTYVGRREAHSPKHVVVLQDSLFRPTSASTTSIPASPRSALHGTARPAPPRPAHVQ
jgi:hypothetical protein